MGYVSRPLDLVAKRPSLASEGRSTSPLRPAPPQYLASSARQTCTAAAVSDMRRCHGTNSSPSTKPPLPPLFPPLFPNRVKKKASVTWFPDIQDLRSVTLASLFPAVTTLVITIGAVVASLWKAISNKVFIHNCTQSETSEAEADAVYCT